MHIPITAEYSLLVHRARKVTLAYVEGPSAGYWVRFPEHSWWIVDALKILIVTKYTMTKYNPFTRYRFQLMKTMDLGTINVRNTRYCNACRLYNIWFIS